VNEHPQFDEDFDLYILGALEGEEKQALESHLPGCSECARKVEEARGRVAALALAAPPEAAPTAVRERLLRQVRREAAKPQVAPVRTFWRWMTPALAVVSLVLAIVAGLVTVENRDLKQRLSDLQTTARLFQKEEARDRAVLDLLTAPDTLKVTLVSGAARAMPEGKAFYHPQKGLLFYAADLPALPPNRTYQLWLVPAEGNPISAGVFQVDAHGNGQVLLPNLPSGVIAKAFAVTVEPAGGVPQPTGTKVLIGAVS
jgi:anti-sigma-K factor RskA